MEPLKRTNVPVKRIGAYHQVTGSSGVDRTRSSQDLVETEDRGVIKACPALGIRDGAMAAHKRVSLGDRL